MGLMLALWLLLKKDFRVMKRRKVSFIIEVIFAFFMILMISYAVYILSSIDLKKFNFNIAANPQIIETNETTFVFTYPENAPESLVYALNESCNAYVFNNVTDEQYFELIIDDFSLKPTPKLKYTIVGHTEQPLFMPKTSASGGLFGSSKPYTEDETLHQALFLQQCINEVMLGFHMDPFLNANYVPISVHQMPPAAASKQFFDGVGFLLSLLYFTIVLMSMKEVCSEKENGIHAYMLAVGLPRPTFYISHFVFSFVKILFVSLIFLILTAILTPKIAFRIWISTVLLALCFASFALLMASIFKRSLYVILSMIAFVVIGYVIKSAGSIDCYSPTTALLTAFLNSELAYLLVMNHYGITAQYEQKIVYVKPFKNYLPVVYPMLIMVFHIVLFLGLTFYIDYVVPIDDTPKLHPLFFLGFGREEESAGEEVKEDSEKEDNSQHEKIKPSGDLELEVKNLVKKWSNGDVAVDHVSFSAYSGQVVALLGHNGAGKSTTFSCLTGFLKPTSGVIHIVNNGRVGYCPQWNPLFPHLTVREHLVFYSQLFTGFVPDDDALNGTFQVIELDKAIDTRSVNLSGGMKRKLSLGIALMSGSRVILLDEPTAGIDTLARRNMVKIIERAKKNHAVVITTHYMDEADALSDHINIMSHGKIICSGSSEFLKNKFTTGIILVVDLALSHRESLDVITKTANEILNVVKKHAPEAEFYGPVSTQFNIVIQSKYRTTFPQLFEELETNKNNFKFESFDVTLNSLDQVFVNVTKQAATTDVKSDVEIKEFIEKRKEVSTGVGSFFKQVFGLFLRKFHSFRRDYLQILLLVVSLLLIIVAVALKAKSIKKKNAYEEFIKMSPSSIDLSYSKYFDNPTAIFTSEDDLPAYDLLEKKLEPLKGGVRKYKIKENKEKFATQYRDTRYKLDIPLIFYFLTSVGYSGLVNSGIKNGHYYAMQLYYDALLPEGAISGTIAFDPLKPDDNYPNPTKLDSSGETIPDLLLIMVYPIIFALPVFLYTTERVSGAVHLYARTQMNKATYWFAAVAIDLLLLTVINVFVTTLLFSVKFYHISCLAPYFVGMFAMSLGFLSQTYVASHLFSSGNITFTLLMVYNLILFLFFQVCIKLIKTKFKEIIYIQIFMPSLAMFQLGQVFHNQCQRQVSFADAFNCPQCDLNSFTLIAGSLGINVLILVLFLGIPRLLSCFTKSNLAVPSPDESADVRKERERVNEGGIEAHSVVAMGLKKHFGLCGKRKTVVEDVTFGVAKNECFGLLGANGAGKSTTFNMLTALIRPTAGKAYVGGVSVSNSPEFGFCPQKESILLDLTVYETFLLFGRLSGVVETHEVAQLVMSSLQLSTRKDVLIHRCSGGEKRRVSIGVALITDPNILMLDEPTAGVDPHTRRFVWDTLITLKNNGTSFVLTSHSMEECETLCTRIAFLAKGRLNSLGTSQHLKHSLGNEYVLTVSLNGQNEKLVEELNKQFSETFKATGENPLEEVNLRYSFAKTDQVMSQMYKQLDEVVAAAGELHPLEASNTPEVKNNNNKDQKAEDKKDEAAPSDNKSENSSKKKPAIRECLITGMTLEDVFIKLAQTDQKTAANALF